MGDRYILTVRCPKCGTVYSDVWYAPTCGIDTFICPCCEHKIDLVEYTGISYEEASNANFIADFLKDLESEKDSEENKECK